MALEFRLTSSLARPPRRASCLAGPRNDAGGLTALTSRVTMLLARPPCRASCLAGPRNDAVELTPLLMNRAERVTLVR
jgi:hypothetical protein